MTDSITQECHYCGKTAQTILFDPDENQDVVVCKDCLEPALEDGLLKESPSISKKEAEKILDTLETIQFSYWIKGEWHCPFCGQLKSDGHSELCNLKEAIDIIKQVVQ